MCARRSAGDPSQTGSHAADTGVMPVTLTVVMPTTGRKGEKRKQKHRCNQGHVHFLTIICEIKNVFG